MGGDKKIQPEAGLPLQQALSLQILVGLLVDHVAAGVLVLLLKHTGSNMSAWPRGTGSASADPTHHTHSPLCLAAIAPAPSETSALPKLTEASTQRLRAASPMHKLYTTQATYALRRPRSA